MDVKRRQSEGIIRQSEGIIRRNRSDSSLSSLDSLASPTHGSTKKTAEKSTNVDAVEKEKMKSDIGKDAKEGLETILSKADASDADNVLRQTPRYRMQRSFTDSRRTSVESAIEKDMKESLKAILTRANAADADEVPRQNPHNPMGRDFTESRRTSLSSMSFDELYSANSNTSDKKIDVFQSSGLAEDVALHLEHSTRTVNTFFSSDGIDHIDPSATGDGRDDFEFAMNSFLYAIKCGHLDEFKDIISCEDEQVLAASAYMGLGFARQCKGELESSLDAYTKSLTLCEDAVGPNDPANASISYTIGTVLVEMQRPFDAADYFSKALHLFKCTQDTGPGNRANILSTEGMLFRVLEDISRAIDCFQKAMLVYQTTSQLNSLKFAAVSFELGSLLSQRGEYIDSAQCFNVALEIRKALLGDSFVVARTHYSLGVTIASQELTENTTFSSASHLEEALRICEQEFKAEHVQSAIIVHALGVLNERKGDSLSASAWFAKEYTMRKLLLGEGKQALHFIFIFTEITQFFPIISPRPLPR
jgi:tetratricopeptide (TPR) repeat protein